MESLVRREPAHCTQHRLYRLLTTATSSIQQPSMVELISIVVLCCTSSQLQEPSGLGAATLHKSKLRYHKLPKDKEFFFQQGDFPRLKGPSVTIRICIFLV